MEQEIWKDIPSFEGYYQASTFGNIRGLDRKVKYRLGERIHKGKIIKPYICNGYKRLCLQIKRNCYSMFVHRLVALTFCERKDIKHEVKHLDNNRINNHYKNLMWDTHLQNIRESIIDGVKGDLPFGWQRPTGKYPVTLYKKIYNLYNSGKYIRFEISKKVKIPTSTVYRIIRTYEKHKDKIDKLIYK